MSSEYADPDVHGGGASSGEAASPDPSLARPAMRRHRPGVRTFLIVVSAISVIYVATFIRGLWWQWKGIILAQPASAPTVIDAPRGAEPRGGNTSSSQGAAQPPNPARKPLARTDTPPPRNTTDDRGVTYDGEGVAVMGIDADPSGVYNVPPGRQVRIGGPAGSLYDVGDGGKLTPAAKR